MSAINYGQCRSLPDLAVRYQFDVYFTRRPSGLEIPSNFSLRCTGTSIPTRMANEPDELWVSGFRVSQPGLESSAGEITLTLFETVDMAVTKFINDWRELNCSNDAGIQAPRSQVTADLKLKLLNRQKQPTWIYTLQDCWISDVSMGDLDATTRSGIMNDISITLQYDHHDGSPA